MSNNNKFRFFLTNFGWFSETEAQTPEDAKEKARKIGFQTTIYCNNELVASFCPLNGFKYYNRELFGVAPALDKW